MAVSLQLADLLARRPLEEVEAAVQRGLGPERLAALRELEGRLRGKRKAAEEAHRQQEAETLQKRQRSAAVMQAFWRLTPEQRKDLREFVIQLAAQNDARTEPGPDAPPLIPGSPILAPFLEPWPLPLGPVMGCSSGSAGSEPLTPATRAGLEQLARMSPDASGSADLPLDDAIVESMLNMYPFDLDPELDPEFDVLISKLAA